MVTTLLNTRELSKETAQVLRKLPETGPRIITRAGKVVGILVPPSGRGIESDIDLMARLRIAQAFDASQCESLIHGTDGISMADINREIRSVRLLRKRKRSSRVK